MRFLVELFYFSHLANIKTKGINKHLSTAGVLVLYSYSIAYQKDFQLFLLYNIQLIFSPFNVI